MWRKKISLNKKNSVLKVLILIVCWPENGRPLLVPPRNDDHISDTLKELHWLPVEQRIIFKINLICFKILNNLAPDYLVDLIHVYEPARYLRSSSDKWRLVIKPYNLKTYGFRAFQSLPLYSGTICLLTFDRSMM